MADTMQIKIIFIDDSPKDIELALDVLRAERMNIDWKRATSTAELESLMKSFKPDFLFTECEVADAKAETILAVARKIDASVMCVVLTSAKNEKRAIALRHVGAINFILKEHISRITFTIEDALEKREGQREAAKNEKQIRESMTRQLMHYLEASPVIIYSLRLKEGQDRWEWVSENASAILGYTIPEILAPNWWFNNLHPIDRSRILSGISKLSEENSLSMEYRFLKKNRSYLWLRDEKRWTVSSTGDNEIVGSLTDISERKTIEEELKLKSSALDAMAAPILITNITGQILWTNDAFETLTGYTNEECIGKKPNDLLNSGAHEPSFYADLWNTVISGKIWKNEIVNRKKNGDLYTIELTITPVPGETGRISYFIGIMNDLTRRIESEKK